MATTVLHTELARETARPPGEIQWDGSTEGSVDRPTLSDFADARQWGDVSSVADLSDEQRAIIANGSIEGDMNASQFDELSSFIVINAEGQLSRDLLESTIQLSGNGNDPDGIRSTAQALLERVFDAEEQSTETEIVCHAGGPTVILEQSGDSIPSEPESPTPSIPNELQALRSQAQSGEKLSADFKSRRTERLDVTGSRLERINGRHSDIDLDEDDVVMFRDYAVHNLPPQEGMRRPLQFTTDALRKFREDYRQGRTMNLHHDGERQVGSTFDAELRTDEEIRGVKADWLVVDWYAPTLNASEQRLQDITDMQSGVLRYTSIEFAGGSWEEQTAESESKGGFYYLIDDNPSGGPDRLYTDGIARVALGAVKGAGSS